MIGALRQGWLHLAVAFFALGRSAMFANCAHPLPAIGISGLRQGGLSALIALFMKRLNEALVRRLDGIASRVLPPLACAAVSVGLLVIIRGIAGTPELLTTIAVPVMVSTTYATL